MFYIDLRRYFICVVKYKKCVGGIGVCSVLN